MKERLKVLEEVLLNEIVNEINRNQGVPVSFEKLELVKKRENMYEGKVHCSEPRHVWTIPVILKIEGNKVSWNLNEKGWYTFELDN